MAIKSADAKEQYDEYLELIRVNLDQAVESGASIMAMADKLGMSRSVLNALRNGTYSSTITATLLIALDRELELGIFAK